MKDGQMLMGEGKQKCEGLEFLEENSAALHARGLEFGKFFLGQIKREERALSFEILTQTGGFVRHARVTQKCIELFPL